MDALRTALPKRCREVSLVVSIWTGLSPRRFIATAWGKNGDSPYRNHQKYENIWDNTNCSHKLLAYYFSIGGYNIGIFDDSVICGWFFHTPDRKVKSYQWCQPTASQDLLRMVTVYRNTITTVY